MDFAVGWHPCNDRICIYHLYSQVYSHTMCMQRNTVHDLHNQLLRNPWIIMHSSYVSIMVLYGTIHGQCQSQLQFAHNTIILYLFYQLAIRTKNWVIYVLCIFSKFIIVSLGQTFFIQELILSQLEVGYARLRGSCIVHSIKITKSPVFGKCSLVHVIILINKAGVD